MSTVIIEKCSTPKDAFKTVNTVFKKLDKKTLAKTIKPGSKILLKPNICNNMRPESGAITKPELVEAVTLKIKSLGAIPIIGEGQVFGIKSNGFATSGLKKSRSKIKNPFN